MCKMKIYENIKFTDNGKSMKREYCFDGILITFNYWYRISKTKVKNQLNYTIWYWIHNIKAWNF